MANGRIVVLLIAGALTASGCGAQEAREGAQTTTTATGVTSTSSERELGVVRGHVYAAFWREYYHGHPDGQPEGVECKRLGSDQFACEVYGPYLADDVTVAVQCRTESCSWQFTDGNDVTYKGTFPAPAVG